jgi:hypothetical protein
VGTLKNISGEALDVSVLRRTVASDEVLEVDDSLLANPELIWPAAAWEVNGVGHQYDPDSADVKATERRAAAKAAREAVKGQEPVTADPAAVSTPAPEVTE